MRAYLLVILVGTRPMCGSVLIISDQGSTVSRVLCKLCHFCQVSGKPNQVIPQAPFKIVLIVNDAFSKAIIDV